MSIEDYLKEHIKEAQANKLEADCDRLLGLQAEITDRCTAYFLAALGPIEYRIVANKPTALFFYRDTPVKIVGDKDANLVVQTSMGFTCLQHYAVTPEQSLQRTILYALSNRQCDASDSRGNTCQPDDYEGTLVIRDGELKLLPPD